MMKVDKGIKDKSNKLLVAAGARIQKKSKDKKKRQMATTTTLILSAHIRQLGGQMLIY